jgi:hypothetical protein
VAAISDGSIDDDCFNLGSPGDDVSEQPMVPVADFERSRKPDRREAGAIAQVPGDVLCKSASNLDPRRYRRNPLNSRWFLGK